MYIIAFSSCGVELQRGRCFVQAQETQRIQSQHNMSPVPRKLSAPIDEDITAAASLHLISRNACNRQSIKGGLDTNKRSIHEGELESRAAKRSSSFESKETNVFGMDSSPPGGGGKLPYKIRAIPDYSMSTIFALFEVHAEYLVREDPFRPI